MVAETTFIDDPNTPILIVDDSVHYAKVLERMLAQGLGYTNVTMLENTNDALDLMRSEPHRFKVLFVDFNFPYGYNGGEFLTILSNEELLEGKIAFLITSEPSESNVRQARDAGATGVVAKPFSRDQLRVTLDTARRTIFADSLEYF